MHKTSLLIVDDHQLIRKGLNSLLADHARFEVIGECGTGDEAVDFLRRLPVDIVLLDIAMPGKNGLDTARELRQLPEPPRVVLLTMHNSPAYIEAALQSGVSGFLLKDAAPHELFSALEAVDRGDFYLSPAISGSLIRGMQQGRREGNLTRRQLEIIRLVALGHSTKEIANQLNLSFKTVETHRSQIMQRLDIRDVTGLVRYAVRHQLIEC